MKYVEPLMNMWTDYALLKCDIVCYMLESTNMLNYESMPLLMTILKCIINAYDLKRLLTGTLDTEN